MNKLCLMLVLLLFTVGFKSHANENITSTIKWLATYTESGNGDVLFTTDTKGSICFGYWISGDAPGFDQSYSVLLAARVASEPVGLLVNAAQEVRYQGSSNHFCKVIRVGLGQF